MTKRRRTALLLAAALAAWSLPIGASEAPECSLTEGLASVFQLGKTLGELRPVLEAGCRSLEEHHYTGAQAEPFTEQTQIDCHGLDVLGRAREVELLFNDGPLGHAWILLGPDDLEPTAEVLRRRFGPVVHETDLDVVFECGTVALRNDPPEVLVATPELIAELTGYSPE